MMRKHSNETAGNDNNGALSTSIYAKKICKHCGESFDRAKELYKHIQVSISFTSVSGEKISD
jgi:hypothetical protein